MIDRTPIANLKAHLGIPEWLHLQAIGHLDDAKIKELVEIRVDANTFEIEYWYNDSWHKYPFTALLLTRRVDWLVDLINHQYDV